jgi:hypothetical protein
MTVVIHNVIKGKNNIKKEEAVLKPHLNPYTK